MYINRFIVSKPVFRVMILNHVEVTLDILEYTTIDEKTGKTLDELHRILTQSILEPDKKDERFYTVLNKLEQFRDVYKTKILTTSDFSVCQL